jgi:hypothetical protein
MFFGVDVEIPHEARNQAFLFTDRWDDWGKFRTQFYLRVVDENGVVHDIGSVKIGQTGLRPAGVVEPGQRAPEIPNSFDALGDNFFSLGQGEDYYVSLNGLNEQLRQGVLRGLRDVAFNLTIFEANVDETVMYESLLRGVHAANVRSRLNRLTRGDASLTRFHFRYRLPLPGDIPPAVMDFEVVPESVPPTNVHVLIGRNGAFDRHHGWSPELCAAQAFAAVAFSTPMIANQSRDQRGLCNLFFVMANAVPVLSIPRSGACRCEVGHSGYGLGARRTDLS